MNKPCLTDTKKSPVYQYTHRFCNVEPVVVYEALFAPGENVEVERSKDKQEATWDPREQCILDTFCNIWW